jgi:CubicO group peptidase (beta-lactamase class C family)
MALARFVVTASCVTLLAHPIVAKAQPPAIDLAGLWAAKLRFGPDIRGTLTVTREGDAWLADFAGLSIPVRFDGRSLSFSLPGGEGSFRGRVAGGEIVGHWLQGRHALTGSDFATPVVLDADDRNRWRGEVRRLDVTSTYYLPVTRQPNGNYRAYLRHIERNQGRFIPVSRLELRGDTVLFIGGRPNEPEEELLRGVHDNGVIRVPINGWTYDFTKVDVDSFSSFYPRGKAPERYTYRPPLQLDDGWPVATVEEVGIDREGIERFVQMLIDMPMDSLSSSQIHSLLIARHGKLVVEEYFHGHSREMPHDTRSASKSWVAVLLGAAMQAGVPVALNTPVYATMARYGYPIPAQLDPRKEAMTLEHLVSMTAGYDCYGENAPGDEDVMQQQTEEPDWYRYTLNVPMLTAPGDTIVYCSIEPNLAAGMLQKIAGEPLPEMFYRLVAKPLQMNNYHLFLSPTGDAYGGGGHRFVPRDFMKLPQLMLNKGRWGDEQIMSGEWANRSGAPQRNLTKTQQYGWLWNSMVYPYGGRTARGFFAGGNGGQIFMGIPELDLVIAFTGGNYADPSMFISQRVFVPEWILPAIN